MVNSVSRTFAGLAIGAGLVTFAAGVAQAQTMVVATDRQGSLMKPRRHGHGQDHDGPFRHAVRGAAFRRTGRLSGCP